MKKMNLSLALIVSILPFAPQTTQAMNFFAGGKASEKVQALESPLKYLVIDNVKAYKIHNSSEYKDMIKVVADDVGLLETTIIKGKGKKIVISGSKKKDAPKGMVDIYACCAYLENLNLTNAHGVLEGKVTIMNDDKDEVAEEPFDDITIRLTNSSLDVGAIQAEEVKIISKKKSRFHVQKVEGELEVRLNNSRARVDYVAGKEVEVDLRAKSNLFVAGRTDKLELKRVDGGSNFDGFNLSSNNAFVNVRGGYAKTGSIAQNISGSVKRSGNLLWASLGGNKDDLNVDKSSLADHVSIARDNGWWQDTPVEEFLRFDN